MYDHTHAVAQKARIVEIPLRKQYENVLQDSNATALKTVLVLTRNLKELFACPKKCKRDHNDQKDRIDNLGVVAHKAQPASK